VEHWLPLDALSQPWGLGSSCGPGAAVAACQFELRRKNRQLEMENEILKRAAAYFARESVLPK
jgi:transposase-like protein